MERYGWIALILAFATCTQASDFQAPRLRSQEEALREIAGEVGSRDIEILLDLMDLISQDLQRVADRSGIGQEEADLAKLLEALAGSLAGNVDSATMVLNRLEGRVAGTRPVRLSSEEARTVGDLVAEHRAFFERLTPVRFVSTLRELPRNLTLAALNGNQSDLRLQRVLDRAARRIGAADTVTLSLPGGDTLQVYGPGVRAEIFDPAKQPVVVLSKDVQISVSVRPPVVDPVHDLVFRNLRTGDAERADRLRAGVVYEVAFASGEPPEPGYSLRSDRVIFLTPEEVKQRSIPKNVQIALVNEDGGVVLQLKGPGRFSRTVATVALGVVSYLLIW